MKHVIAVALILALLGWQANSPRAQDNVKENALSETVAPEKPLSYLAKPLKGKVSQRGLYKLVRSGGVVKDSRTSTGKAISKPVIQLVESTDRIPLIKGAQMHMQYRIWHLPDQPAYVDLKRVLKHPEFSLPDGSVSTGSEYMIKGKVSVNQIIAYTGYGLDEDYEMVEGDWIFEIWHQDKKLIEQTFTAYWPNKEEIVALEQKLTPGAKPPSSKKPSTE